MHKQYTVSAHGSEYAVASYAEGRRQCDATGGCLLQAGRTVYQGRKPTLRAASLRDLGHTLGPDSAYAVPTRYRRGA